MDNYSIRNWILPIRPKTLAAGFSPVLLAGVVAGNWQMRSVLLWGCCFVVAISLQISANLINDYYDWYRQVDGSHSLGPIRVTSSGLISPVYVLLVGLLFLALAAVVGLFAAWLSSWYILLPGALCLLFAWGYTGGPVPLAYLALGEVSAFVFFGLIAGCGSYFVITGRLDLVCLPPAIQSGLYAAAIMSVNNLRDIATDIAGGKRTFAGRIGERGARKVTIAIYMLAVFMPLASVWVSGNWYLALTLVVLPFALVVSRKISVEPISGRFNDYLAMVAITEVLASVLFSILTLL